MIIGFFEDPRRRITGESPWATKAMWFRFKSWKKSTPFVVLAQVGSILTQPFD
jgi:hypothetical protein